MKKRRPTPSKPIILPLPAQVQPTAQPEDYLTNFEVIDSIKNDLFDLAEISEKELLEYSRVQAMLRKFEQEQKKDKETTEPPHIVAAIPAPL